MKGFLFLYFNAGSKVKLTWNPVSRIVGFFLSFNFWIGVILLWSCELFLGWIRQAGDVGWVEVYWNAPLGARAWGGGYIMMSVFSGRWCEENRRQTTAAGTKFIIHCFIIAFSRMSVQYSMKYGCKSVCLNWNEVCVCLAHKHTDGICEILYCFKWMNTVNKNRINLWTSCSVFRCVCISWCVCACESTAVCVSSLSALVWQTAAVTRGERSCAAVRQTPRWPKTVPDPARCYTHPPNVFVCTNASRVTYWIFTSFPRHDCGCIYCKSLFKRFWYRKVFEYWRILHITGCKKTQSVYYIFCLIFRS